MTTTPSTQAASVTADAATDVLSTICDFIRYATTLFNAANLSFTHGFDAALDEATYLVLHTLHLPHDMPPAYGAATLLATERVAVLARIEQRLARKPLAYITGEAWFGGMAFKVDETVLIPRSPIAELIEQSFEPWLTGMPSRILDLCTGSGCIGIACAAHFGDAHVDLVDLSDDALKIAHFNAQQHGLESRVELVQSDLFSALKGRKYDLIVTNPPYVSSQEMTVLAPEFAHEPVMALVSGSDGLDAPLTILEEASHHLTPNGVLVLEVGASEAALLAVLPDLPGEWVEFARGGSGVVVIGARALVAYRSQIKRALAERAGEL
jgi:ribosomal protein L3 glutamine methyltransferase